MANKSGGLLMNSKGGIYTTLAAMLVIAVMSASMMQVLAVQDDVGAKIAGSAARDVKLAWVNARYLADDGVGRVLYNAAIDAGCKDPGTVSVSTQINNALSEINGANCTVSAANCQSGSLCAFTLTCENGIASFWDTVNVTKNVSVTPDGACIVVVTDA